MIITVVPDIERVNLDSVQIFLNRGAANPKCIELRYLQTLKEKHGIDYDSHGSYRFVERER